MTTYMTLEDSSLNTEVVKVTGISSNTLTIARAQDGTSARALLLVIRLSPPSR